MRFNDPHLVQMAGEIKKYLYKQYGASGDDAVKELLLYVLNDDSRDGRWVEVIEDDRRTFPRRQQDCPRFPEVPDMACWSGDNPCCIMEEIEGFVRCGESDCNARSQWFKLLDQIPEGR